MSYEENNPRERLPPSLKTLEVFLQQQDEELQQGIDFEELSSERSFKPKDYFKSAEEISGLNFVQPIHSITYVADVLNNYASTFLSRLSYLDEDMTLGFYQEWLNFLQRNKMNATDLMKTIRSDGCDLIERAHRQGNFEDAHDLLKVTIDVLKDCEFTDSETSRNIQRFFISYGIPVMESVAGLSPPDGLHRFEVSPKHYKVNERKCFPSYIVRAAETYQKINDILRQMEPSSEGKKFIDNAYSRLVPFVAKADFCEWYFDAQGNFNEKIFHDIRNECSFCLMNKESQQRIFINLSRRWLKKCRPCEIM